jgi:acyl-CoA thioester hydrolase
VRVYYEDTDAGGFVYHANYLKFMERARSEWFRSLGFEQDQLLHDHNLLFAVTRVQIQYLRPARFNELLEVDVRIVQCRRASFEFAQDIERVKACREVLCHGQVRVACVDGESLRPRSIPSFILSELTGER